MTDEETKQQKTVIKKKKASYKFTAAYLYIFVTGKIRFVCFFN